MDSLLYDAAAALRRLPKTPWFTLAVVMTLAMQPDGTLKVTQELGGNTRSGTGKKKV